MINEVFVDVGEPFQIPFHVSGRSAGGGSSGTAEVSQSGPEDLLRLVRGGHNHGVRVQLIPLQSAFLPIDAQAEVVFAAHADLAGVQHAFGSVVEAQQDIAIVLQLAAFDKNRQVSGQFLDVQARNVFRKVDGVRADIAHATGRAADGRIGAPGGLFLPGAFKQRGEPPLRILDHHFADLAQLALFHHLAGFLHQGIAGVVIGDTV